MTELLYLGRGLTQPMVVVKSKWQYQSGNALVEQSMMILLNTPVGTKFFLPEYGSRCRELLFETNDTVLSASLRFFILDAIRKWEKRVNAFDVTFEFADNGKVNCEIHYYPVGSNVPDSFIYPFNRKTKY